MQGPRLSEERQFRVEFYDVDSMRIAWHGNYVKYMELGRCALLDKIGFGYTQMAVEASSGESQFVSPPCLTAKVEAMLEEGSS